jgi:hypothetical protein
MVQMEVPTLMDGLVSQIQEGGVAEEATFGPLSLVVVVRVS